MASVMSQVIVETAGSHVRPIVPALILVAAAIALILLSIPITAAPAVMSVPQARTAPAVIAARQARCGTVPITDVQITVPALRQPSGSPAATM